MSKNKGQNESSDGFSDRELQAVHGREQKDRSGLFLPFFLSLVACTWFTWGGIGISADANSFALHPDREMTPEELAAAEARAKARMSEFLYGTYCGSCHQPHGRGVPGTYPPLDGSEWVDNGERVVGLTLAGMIGRIEVMGQVYDVPNGMPAVARAANLKPEQIASIVNYVRSSWSNAEKDYAEITVEEVEAVTKELSDRSTQWTAEELLEKYPFDGDSE